MKFRVVATVPDKSEPLQHREIVNFQQRRLGKYRILFEENQEQT